MWAEEDGNTNRRRVGAKVTRWMAGETAGNEEAKQNRSQTKQVPRGAKKCEPAGKSQRHNEQAYPLDQPPAGRGRKKPAGLRIGTEVRRSPPP